MNTQNANAMIDALRAKLSKRPGTEIEGRTVEAADAFAYDDPSAFMHETQYPFSNMIAIVDQLLESAQDIGHTAPDVRT